MASLPATDHALVHLPAGQADPLAARLGALVQRSMFWRPRHLSPSAWLEHIPFAFWLIEAHRPRVLVELGTHHGSSYFAFCQAVERLGLDTRCYAVDTWKGDEHAGFYGEEVFQSVHRLNEEHYSGFSRLVRSTFEDAAGHFAPASVDLLHIDGLHTLESVAADFRTWLPKLSDDAVVLFHDTNVRERGFGVGAFFETLKGEYPSFEFVHGHGLGVIHVGRGERPLVGALLRADGDPDLRQAVRDVFGRLGRGVADAALLKRGEAAAGGQDQAAEILRLRSALDEQARAIDSRFFELAKLTDALERERDTALRATAEAAAARAAADRAEARLGKLSNVLSKARKLERQHMAILNSTSWRILAPMRSLVRLLRRQPRRSAYKRQF